jgi:hypothetical protein
MKHSLLALAVGLLLITAGSASAQTTDFKAEVKGHQTRSKGCPDGATFCADAIIQGFGPAQYRFFVSSFEPTSESCADVTGTVTFTLLDGSRLTLDESSEPCGTGQTFFKGDGYGNPAYQNGSWTVQSATGQFAGMTGSGTSSAHLAGAHFSATYIGTLEG